MYRLVIVCLLLTAPSWLSAQGFLDRLLDKTAEKVSETVTDEASDKAAEESSEAVDKFLDGLFDDSETEESADPAATESTQKSTHSAPASTESNMDEEQMNAMLEQMMGGMDKSADVPAEYRFDMALDITIQDGDEDPTYLTLLMQESGKVFGMKTDDGNGGTQTSVIDGGNSLMVIFQDPASGKRTGMGLPNMMGAAAQMGGAQMGGAQLEEAEASWADYSFDATGKTKKVAGYTCKEYRASGPDGEALIYTTNSLPVNWMEALSNGFGDQMPNAFASDYPAGMEGSMLESRSTDAKTGDVITWVTTAVHKDGATIRKADYTFGMDAMK